MGRIQSDVGLVTGIQIGDTVTKLMTLAAKPRDNLSTQTDQLKTEQSAVTELSALLLATQYLTDNLGKAGVFDTRSATSSSGALSATVTGDAVNGNYQFTPVQMAQRQQFLSSGFSSTSETLAAGKLTFRYGSNVQRALPLAQINGGQGLTRGSIRITDHSGATAQIDLSSATTLDDVLNAINTNTTIDVSATLDGDKIRLTDRTGLSFSNLRVREVGGGTTAASLGLAGIDTAATGIDGQDLVRLSANTELAGLNDGNGVRISTVFPDIRYTLRDGTTGSIDLSPIPSGTSKAVEEVTVGDVLNRINAAAPGKLKAEIGADGKRLVVTDLTSGSVSFQLQSLYSSNALADLGLDGTSTDGVISGRRIIGGAQSVLLSSLGGGQGLGTLGKVSLSDRSGAQATVDLASAETLQDVVDKINQSGIGITASVNDARNGLQLTDTTGAAGSNLVVASADATNTAQSLGVAVNSAVSTVNSGDLHLKVVSDFTPLSSLNGGAGVTRGMVSITDSYGRQATLDLTDAKIQTVGDVVKAINQLNLNVYAELNDTGDGIRVRATGSGSGRLTIAEQGSTTAADLHLLGTAVDQSVDGATTQVIDGSTTLSLAISAGDSLADLVAKINALHAGVTASTFVDGSSRPVRLAIQSSQTGTAGQMVLDASGAGFSLDETAQARDAVLAVGSSQGSSSLLVTSSTNTFSNVLPGVQLTVNQASASPVTVSVSNSDTNVLANVKLMVDDYNKLRGRLNDLTAYDTATDTRATLTGDSTALQMENGLADLLSDHFSGTGSIQSLGQLGITLKDDGTLAYDESTLKSAFAADPAAVKKFFTAADTGFSARFHTLSESLVGQDVSIFAQRYKSLDAQITENQSHLDAMDARLSTEKDAMLMKFYNMELAIAKIQANASIIQSFYNPYASTTSSNSNSGA